MQIFITDNRYAPGAWQRKLSRDDAISKFYWRWETRPAKEEAA